MDRLRKLTELEKCFAEKKERTPKHLMEKIECSRHTLYRIIEMAVNEFNMPLHYDRKKRVWRLEESDGQIKVPYTWFSAKDVRVLLTLLETYRDMPFGIMGHEIDPFKKKLEGIMNNENGEIGELFRKIKVIPICFRKLDDHTMPAVCEALAMNRRLRISYRGRQNNELSEREISPIQLVRYRDNWYLDAFCHKRNNLRIFSLDRIEKVGVVDERARKASRKELEEYFAESYGIFSGKPKATAVLKFSAVISKWVSCEKWHPKQETSYDKDGSYILKFPYSDERELILDIMRYGDSVEVLAPKTLREAVKEKHKKALAQY